MCRDSWLIEPNLWAEGNSLFFLTFFVVCYIWNWDSMSLSLSESTFYESLLSLKLCFLFFLPLLIENSLEFVYFSNSSIRFLTNLRFFLGSHVHYLTENPYHFTLYSHLSKLYHEYLSGDLSVCRLSFQLRKDSLKNLHFLAI